MTRGVVIRRVVVADDDLLVRAGVVAVLATLEGIEVVAEAASLPELEAAVAETSPDVVVTDIRMPPTLTDEGVRAARWLRSLEPPVGVVVLSQHAEPDFV
ncbi:MAG: response regulator, partial [Acidimicrobiales bacterium]